MDKRVGYAGVQLFPLAMLPDVAARDAKRTGSNRIGVCTGVWTAGETLGLAVGPGVYAPGSPAKYALTSSMLEGAV